MMMFPIYPNEHSQPVSVAGQQPDFTQHVVISDLKIYEYRVPAGLAAPAMAG